MKRFLVLILAFLCMGCSPVTEGKTQSVVEVTETGPSIDELKSWYTYSNYREYGTGYIVSFVRTIGGFDDQLCIFTEDYDLVHNFLSLDCYWEFDTDVLDDDVLASSFAKFRGSVLADYLDEVNEISCSSDEDMYQIIAAYDEELADMALAEYKNTISVLKECFGIVSIYCTDGNERFGPFTCTEFKEFVIDLED